MDTRTFAVFEIELIQRPDASPPGAGEAAAAPVPGAPGNALFDAIGARRPTAPFRPQRLNAAPLGGRER